MTEKTTDGAPFIQALSFALYALHDQLVENGGLRPGQLSATLRRYDPGPDELNQKTAAIMAGLADNLELMQFGVAGTRRRFDLIDGGKLDDPEPDKG